jgi:hypothetical protein
MCVIGTGIVGTRMMAWEESALVDVMASPIDAAGIELAMT